MITILLALLLSIPVEVNDAQPFCPEQQPMPPAQLPAQNSQCGNAVAAILQSGSTNARGYVITIYDNGSATAVLDSAENSLRSSPTQLQQFPAGTIDASRLQALLEQIGDVSTIPTGSCPKSVSFGTRTQISYDAKTSGDLQCIRAESGTQETLLRNSEKVGQFVQDTLRRLNVNSRRVEQER
jgi:hypothetical protein